MADLRVEFAGVPFKNPIVIASAEPTMSVSKMKQSIDTGAGGFIVKTLTDLESMRKLSGYAQWIALNEQHEKCQGRIPRAFSFYGRSGLSAEPPEVWIEEVKKLQPYAEEHNCVIIGSVGASTPDSWARLAKMQEDAGIKLIEFNFGCPHPSQMENAKTGMLIGQDIDMAAKCVHAAAKEVSVPIVVKLTPQVVDLVDMSRAVKQAGASAVTLTNRFVGFAVDIETGRPFLNSWAGVGGPWVTSTVGRGLEGRGSSLSLSAGFPRSTWRWISP
ncbi:MAG: tRNA-dihydrouridine synthase [Chloroflexi bacterium]|nr:tRNA-dihydrouridine synthase [Chloroflexota bacterium]